MERFKNAIRKRKDGPARRWILTFSLVIFLCLPGTETYAQKNKLISVLIVDGFSNHDWRQTTAVTKWILKQSDRFEIDVTTVPMDSTERLSWHPAFSKYDVVIQNTNNIHNKNLRWPDHAETALEKFVMNGGGLYILHSANNSFSHWEEYDKMIGMGWRPVTSGFALEVDINKNIVRHPPGEGQGTSHGDRFNAVIHILKSHPINKDYPKAWQTVNTEVYSFPRGPAKDVTVLSYAYDSAATKKMWPVEWVVKYGKGRVYNSSLGHLWRGEKYPPAYRCVGYQTTVIRAVEWLATGNVTFPVPDDFPTEHASSLKPEIDFIDRD